MNGFAIGSWIELRWPDGRVTPREITSGGGHVSGRSIPEHFGLGELEEIEMRVVWPSGQNSEWMRVAAGQRYQIWQHENGVSELRRLN